MDTYHELREEPTVIDFRESIAQLYVNALIEQVVRGTKNNLEQLNKIKSGYLDEDYIKAVETLKKEDDEIIKNLKATSLKVLNSGLEIHLIRTTINTTVHDCIYGPQENKTTRPKIGEKGQFIGKFNEILDSRLIAFDRDTVAKFKDWIYEDILKHCDLNKPKIRGLFSFIESTADSKDLYICIADGLR